MAFPTNAAAVPPPLFDNIPTELRALPQWVCWRLEPRPGEDKLTKVPYDPKNGKKASAGQPGTWATFAAAAAAYNGSQKGREPYSGVGFELADEDGLFGGDLDGCIDPATGEVAEWASAIVAEASTYTESSPSGTGLRFFGFGALPPGRRRDGPVELYDRGRFLTLTGRRFAGTPPGVADCSAILPALHARLFPPKPAPVARPRSEAGASVFSLSDQELLATASRAANGAKFDALMRGDTSAYGGDDSAADLALCSLLAFYAGPDAGRIERLFGQSALAQREKWGRADYVARTIAAALAGRSEFYSPPGDHAERSIKTAARANDKYSGPKSSDRPAATPSPNQQIRPAEEGFRLTDLGNAERLVARHGHELRYSPALGWIAWDGCRWRRDDSGEIMRRAKQTIRQIYAEASVLTTRAAALPPGDEDGPDRELAGRLGKMAAALLDWAKKSEAAPRLAAAIELAKTEPGIYVQTDQLDADPWLLNCQNGTLDLRSGALMPHRSADLLTKICPVAYDAAATAPLWEKCLSVWQSEAEVGDFLRRAAGYSLTGLTGEETAFFLYGTGRNGKSKFTEALQGVMGEYAVRVPIETLMQSRKGEAEGATPHVAKLAGARLVIASEVKQSRRLDESFVKDVTGGDVLTARHLYHEPFEFKPALKLWIYGNHKPQISGTDDGIWSRLPLIPFTVTIPVEQRDTALSAKLMAEYPGILAWAVRGCMEWQRSRLSPPAAVLKASAAYREEMDPLAGFFEACCVMKKDAWATAADLRAAYETWATAEGVEKHYRVAQNDFAERLRHKGCRSDKRKREGKQERGWWGIGMVVGGTPGTPVDAVSSKVPYINHSRKDFAENSVPGVPGVPDEDTPRLCPEKTALADRILAFVKQTDPAKQAEIIPAMGALGHAKAEVQATITELQQHGCIEFDVSAGGYVLAGGVPPPA